MPVTATSAIESIVEKHITLPDRLENLSSSYRNARPFPHVILDSLFPASMLDNLVEEMPRLGRESWVQENDERLVKFNLRSAVELGNAGLRLVAFLHSASFLYFLSEMTGIHHLLPDPYLKGSGYHVMPPGGHFDIHCDRNVAYETGLARRLALIVYLNKSWDHKYGGQLELWNSTGTKCEVVVEPFFNRTVIFEVADGGYHGVPSTVACPEGRSRNSFAVYYHTVGVNGNMAITPHSSIYSPSFFHKEKITVRSVVRDLMPPILHRAYRRLRGIKANPNDSAKAVPQPTLITELEPNRAGNP